MSFLGSVEYQMDDRNRVAMPPKYREQFDAPAVLTTSRDRCVAVYTQASFDEAATVVESMPEDTAEGRRRRRFFFGNAYPVAKDGQGRLLIPPKLIEHAGLKKDVVVVGLGRWFEIWDKQTYDERVAATEEEEE